LGVATPSNLIQNKASAIPFNIGQAIDLEGFKLSECAPLIAGLTGFSPHPQAIIEEVLYWTRGRPFLTQKLCRMVANQLQKRSDLDVSVDEEKQLVKTLVKTQIIDHWESQDEPEHLRTIRDRLLYSEQSRAL